MINAVYAHTTDTTKVEYHPPTEVNRSGWITIGDLTLIPPQSPEDALDFWTELSAHALSLAEWTQEHNGI